MRNELLDTLRVPEEIDWDNHPAKSALLATWTFVKWITLGLLVAAGMIVWFIFSIVFAGLFEKEFK